jgi:glucokinase
MGTPGIVNPSEGVVRNAVNLGWTEVSLVEGIKSRLGLDLPVWVQKDTNASALGEYYFGAARNCSDFVYLSVGSGLGGGIISNGKIITGASWQSSELGHFSLDPKGKLCVCGLRGCAETVVSGPGLLSITREYLAKGQRTTLLKETATLTTTEILAAARKDDPLAIAVFNEVGSQLGIIIGVCVAVLNPAMFIIGGGLGLAAFDLIVPAARRELEQRVIPSSYQKLEIGPSCLTSSAVGPSCLVWYGLNSQ